MSPEKIEKHAYLGLSSAAVARLVQDCSFKFWRSPEGVARRLLLPLGALLRLCPPFDAVNGEIMLETALVSRLVVGVRLKLNTFLTLGYI